LSLKREKIGDVGVETLAFGWARRYIGGKESDELLKRESNTKTDE